MQVIELLFYELCFVQQMCQGETRFKENRLEMKKCTDYTRMGNPKSLLQALISTKANSAVNLLVDTPINP